MTQASTQHSWTWPLLPGIPTQQAVLFRSWFHDHTLDVAWCETKDRILEPQCLAWCSVAPHLEAFADLMPANSYGFRFWIRAEGRWLAKDGTSPCDSRAGRVE